jgi:hypothetical protein
MEVRAGAMALGIPARVKEGAADPESIARARDSYVRRVSRYRSGLRRIE